MKTWSDFYDSCDFPSGNPLPATEQDLNEAEDILRFKLPDSYRQYCMIFGPGVYRYGFTIYCPEPKPFRGKLDLVRHNLWRHGIRASEVDEYAPDPKRHRRLIFFGDQSRPDYVWDPADAPQPTTNERPVYSVEEDWSVARVADTFFEFLTTHRFFEERPVFEPASSLRE